MRFWVGITDRDWFDYLTRLGPEEANFWQPSGSRQFRAVPAGAPFLFKLHRPENFVVGGGSFIRYSALPASLAWEAFGDKNGVSSYAALLDRIARYRHTEELDPIIGCNLLAQPYFLPRDHWIPAPSDWAPNIVQGKTYDTNTREGEALWGAVTTAMSQVPASQAPTEPIVDPDELRFGAEYLARARLGQGTFRVLVTEAYSRRCAITGERTLPVLEAAHIKPYSEEGPHKVSNGLLLRSDLHTLFDRGYLTVTPELRVEVSRRIRDEWQNGREYYAYHGKPLEVRPDDLLSRPSPEFLAWHNEHRFGRSNV
jgi:putative restriction endonuclease